LVSGKTLYKYLLLLGSTLILSHCSVEKNTGLSRFYQSLTARDNIYFNGLEAYKSGVIKAANASIDDYSEVLRVFEYSDQGTVTACTPDMERAIQKASKVISLKSITAKPGTKETATLTEKDKEFISRKEFNEWVDDSYLLMAKARFYKHEYNLAKSTFNFCLTDANDISIKTEAGIWIARICNETADYTESLRILGNLDLSKVSSRGLKTLYYTTLADLFIKQKRYSEAISPLTSSLNFISGKKNKYRLTYLLAQLYEKTGNMDMATSLYHKVVKMNPPYDIEFNARINMAGTFDISSGNPDEIQKELGQMLRDSKNKEFRDQIYYVLGDLAGKEGNEKEAIEFYHKSAAVSTQNRNQKGKSFLALARYYYEKPDYVYAQNFYDSAVIFLDTKYPDYLLYKAKSENLNELVSQLTIVQTEDSLQRVALMDVTQRNALITGIINKVTRDETINQSSGNSDRSDLGEYYQNELRNNQISSQEGKWYFYNQTSLTFGRTEFRRRWGERKLEDNWRRSNKSIINTDQLVDNMNTIKPDNSDSALVVPDKKNPEYYLTNLPVNDSLLNISNNRIATALFNAGKVYTDRIEDNKKAIETYQLLITRYPGNDLVSEAVYNIYSIYMKENNSGAEKYRQLLLEKYPDTEFARIISDPDYYNKKKAELKVVEELYENAYNKYLNEDYYNTVALCDEALSVYKTHELAPKFQLLRAYAIAKLKDERSFKDELNVLIKQWPGTVESQRANELIAFLNKEIPELKVEEDKAIAREIYFEEPNVAHYFVLIIQDPKFNINQATFDVINFNIDNYTNKNYRTQGLLVDDKYIMITVGNFTNAEQALEYYRTFVPETIVRNAKKDEIITFVISNSNLDTLNKDKDPNRYQIFFSGTYINKTNDDTPVK
jgi:tetratricopeptide (TPR) repeat protein